MRGPIRIIIILLAIIQSFFFWKIKKREPKKILIAHNLLLGDTLLLTPLMKRIYEKYPEQKKYILAKPEFISLYKNTPYQFTALTFNSKSLLDIWKIFCAGPYDLTFVAGDNRYSWFARAMGSRWIVGIANDRPQWKNWMLDEAKSFDLKPATWSDMMGRLVDNIDPEPYEKNDWLRPNIKKPLFFKNPKFYIVCHLGASTPLKLWSAKSWQILIQQLKHEGFEIFISVGPGEQHLIAEVDPSGKCHQVPGTYSLLEMWFLIEHAKLLISVDTGIAHLAKLAGTPTVTLFGPGSTLSHGAGNFWKFLDHANITRSEFNCRNQAVLFRRKVDWLKRCGRNFNQCSTPGACMDVITPEHVMNSISKNNLVANKNIVKSLLN